ncbi:HAMP domain-containing protein, partial [Halobellus sp. Atlit-31R]
RNLVLKTASAELDKKISQIKTLKEEIEALKARQQAVEDLQGDRNQPVYLLDELVRQTPADGEERSHVEAAAQAHRLYVRAARDVVELAHADQTIGANAMIKPEAASSVLVQRMTMLARLERQMSEQASNSAAADFRLSAGLMPYIVLLAVGVSLAITVAVRRVLLREIRGIGAAALGLASGDLTVGERVYGEDEIGETSRALDAGIRNL